MVDSTLRSLTQAEVQEAVRNKRVVLLSPRLHYRNTLLADFTAGQDTYLYCLLPHDKNLLTFLENISDELAAFTPKFGTQVKQALKTGHPQTAELAEAFVADLRKGAIKTLILDELDRLEVSAETAEFFERFVEKLPSSMQLILNGRYFSYYPWNRMVQAGDAVVLGEEQALTGGIFSATESERQHVEVYAFGTGTVYANGLPVETWDGPLPQHLFYYLIDHPLVTRDDIFETFWPELNPKEATNVFHVTKRKVSERLGYELTTYSSGFYRPSKEIIIHYDVEHFEQNYKKALSKHNNATIDDWYNVIRLYRYEFLHDFDMPWMNDRRESLRNMYADALINLARIHESAQDLDRAIHYFLRGLREMPLREDIYRTLMTIYQQQGEHEKALELYKTLEATLYRRLKIKPSPMTIEIYKSALDA